MMEGVGEGGMAPFADALATRSGHDAVLMWRYPSLLIRGRSALLRTPLIFPLQPTYKSGSRQNQIKGLVAPYSNIHTRVPSRVALAVPHA